MINGQGAPYNYDYKNAINSLVTPSTVHVRNTGLQAYFRRYLLQKAISVFKWKIPETWAENYFLYVLYSFGYIAILNTDKFGPIPQGCGLSGYDVFYRPAKALVTNPLLKGPKELTINKDCVLLQLQPDYGGVMDIVNYYADMMALCAETSGTNLLNSKLSYVFTADNKAAAESFKKLYDNIASGEPCVVQDSRLTRQDGSPAWQSFSQNVGSNYIVSDILTDMRKWESMFDTDIGIPNANTDKRERLISSEVEANNVETASKCELWLETLQKGCRKASDMFNIELDVEWRYNPIKGSDMNARNTNPDGDV